MGNSIQDSKAVSPFQWPIPIPPFVSAGFSILLPPIQISGFSMLKLSFLLTLLSSASSGLWHDEAKKSSVGIYPPACTRIECPVFDVIQLGNGYEIRRYNSSVWMSTSSIQDISLVDATRTGFLRLFDYIQGKNSYEEKIEMTAPVITEVSPSDGPFCESSFTVSFYVPKENQANPPPAKGLHVQRWKTTYVAVRQFKGFVTDSNVGEEAAALQASLADTIWAAAIEKSHPDSTTVYAVAQYNSPFEFDNRVNEIWMQFYIDDDLLVM
ncbi:hypothetical protein SADUNF_Sadunf16G0249000 [Salix dunnii]|uniref:SOUL heme-binding family protein n=1 Tax=Salix dunnii TaxID=1413687 RepID=A0A835JBX4_9ROSI|nr:hypothetical protein SADUNF_Sadunf16G0249000 [Salix dunnii]